MDKQYSVQFFQSLVENIQNLCRDYLNFDKFVEVTGYISVELDNRKKERYVLCELLHNNGHSLSESYCTKAFKTCYSWNSENSLDCEPQREKPDENIRSYAASDNQQNSCRQAKLNVKEPWTWDQRNPKDCSQQLTNPVIDLVTDDDFDNASSSVSTKRRCLPSKNAPRSFISGTLSNYGVKPKPIITEPADQSLYNSQLGNNCSKSVHVGLPQKEFSGISNHRNINQSVKYSHGHRQQESMQKPYSASNVMRSGTQHSPSSCTLAPETHLASGSQNCSEVKVTLPHGSNVPSDNVVVKPDPEASSFNEEDNDAIDLDMYDDDPNDSQSDFPQLMEDMTSQEFAFAASVNPLRMCQFRKGTSQNNPYIEKVTRYAVKKLNKFCFTKTGQHVKLLSVPPVELDAILSDFFNGLRKKDGNPYDPRSLRTMQCNIDKHLKNEGYAWSILKDIQFSGSRETLKTLLGDKVSNKPQFRYDPLTEDDIETLFNTEQLGLSNPESLTNSMWLLNIYFFGIKSLTEHFHLKWGDIVLLEDDKGLEYLQHVLKGVHLGGPKLYAKPHNPSRCFVHLYKQYIAKRPVLALEATTPFYLNSSRNIEHDGWYSLEPLSWYRLASLWKKMVLGAGLPQDKRPMFNYQVASTGFH